MPERPPALTSIYRKPWGNRIFAFGVFVFLLFIAFAAFMLFCQKDYPNLSILLGAGWVVFVPVYFLMEHLFFFRNFGRRSQYDQFKRVQDLAAKIWAAAVVVLAAIYAHKFPG
jgi:hypothetical protein